MESDSNNHREFFAINSALLSFDIYKLLESSSAQALADIESFRLLVIVAVLPIAVGYYLIYLASNYPQSAHKYSPWIKGCAVQGAILSLVCIFYWKLPRSTAIWLNFLVLMIFTNGALLSARHQNNLTRRKYGLMENYNVEMQLLYNELNDFNGEMASNGDDKAKVAEIQNNFIENVSAISGRLSALRDQGLSRAGLNELISILDLTHIRNLNIREANKQLIVFNEQLTAEFKRSIDHIKDTQH